ncbi:MAG: DNA repair protein RadA, partial [Candidatus Peregrinibacteria bacterium]
AMKLKTIYVCKECSHEEYKWTGKCPSCEAWNSFVEDTINVGKSPISPTARKAHSVSPAILSNIKEDSKQVPSGIVELDRVMGGGIIPGGLTLLSGEPGIGKSTLTLQIAGQFAKKGKVLLISGEESLSQVASRAKRLNINEKNLTFINEFALETILETIKKEKPSFAIIDSIQVISSLDIPSQAGSITQVRYCTEQIMELAKTSSIPIFLIGHVTKDGNLAGPRVLEHLVDTVLQLEGDRFQQFRILRASKNRFGSCSEVGIFEMAEKGLVEVKNPSEQFLEGRKKNSIGSVITVAMEGTRPFLVEVQALVSRSPFGYPKRTSNGFDLNRLQLLIAVLEKYGKFNLQNQDVYVNIVGGMKLTEPAADLAILSAIASSLNKNVIPSTTAIFGEVGLSGELRKVSHHEKRIKEAEKLGFTKLITPEKFKEISDILNLFSGKTLPHFQ